MFAKNHPMPVIYYLILSRWLAVCSFQCLGLALQNVPRR
uniref:Uncharacterized protein n=1 Tax=Anguilla anguilla TaxID=7936 RepID=A0A0E9S173_ANGAN